MATVLTMFHCASPFFIMKSLIKEYLNDRVNIFLSSWANLRYTHHPVISNMMEHYNPWCDKYVHSLYQGSHHISIHKSSIWNAFSLLWKTECFQYGRKSFESAASPENIATTSLTILSIHCLYCVSLVYEALKTWACIVC